MRKQINQRSLTNFRAARVVKPQHVRYAVSDLTKRLFRRLFRLSSLPLGANSLEKFFLKQSFKGFFWKLLKEIKNRILIKMLLELLVCRLIWKFSDLNSHSSDLIQLVPPVKMRRRVEGISSLN